MNGRYLREKLEPSEVLEKLVAWKANPKFLEKIIPLALQRLETLADFFPMAQFLFSDTPEYEVQELIGKLDPEQVPKILKITEWELEK